MLESTQSLISLESKLILFDLATTGHHPTYVRYLIEYWHYTKMPGKLFIVTSPKFLKKHPEFKFLESSTVEFILISPEEDTKISQARSFFRRIFLEWDIYCKYAEILKADHSLLMYFDTLQLPIVFGRSSPCKFSGVYFRPSFHYKEINNCELEFKDIWRAWRQKKLLSLVLRNKRLFSLLSLDEYAIPYIKKLDTGSTQIRYLCDPVISEVVDKKKVVAVKKELNIEGNRLTFLLFGSLNERKGIYQVLNAIKLLDPSIAQKCCFLIVGELSKEISTDILTLVSEISKISSAQVITKFGYQTDDILSYYFSAADIVLAPYQKHVGMSGVLMLASAYGKPILSSKYGLLGKLVKDYNIGETVSPVSPINLVTKISEIVCDENRMSLEKSAKLKKLACSSHPNKFSKIIFNTIS